MGSSLVSSACARPRSAAFGQSSPTSGGLRQALHIATTTVLCVAESSFTGFKHAACGGADVAESVVLLACPAEPVPLAARGLAAVLARASPAGAPGCLQAMSAGPR